MDLRAYTAWELWKKYFDSKTDPFIDNDFGDCQCHFCGGERPNHEEACIYLVAKKMVYDD